MVRVNAIDSTEESEDIAKRKNEEEEVPMADSSDEKAKTTESYRVLSQVAVTIITIGIDLVMVSAVIFWIWKRQMENILKTKCSSEDDNGDHKPDSSTEKGEQRNDQKNLNGKTRNPAVLNKYPTKENKSQSLLSQNNFEHFSNWNSLPEQQLERVTQVASAVRHKESEKINETVLYQARSKGIPPINSAITNTNTNTLSTINGNERFNLCSEEKKINETVLFQARSKGIPPINSAITNSNTMSSSGKEMFNLYSEEKKIDNKSQNNMALQVCRSEQNTIIIPSFGINIKCNDSTESSSDANVDEKVRAQEPISHSLNHLRELNKPKDIIDGSMTSKLNDMFPQDNHITLVSEPCPNEKQKNLRQQLVKSLDLHITSLEKGCKLLETKPAKSSLRRSGSEESLKKYVHFPEEIRDIRIVHKYHSLQDIIFLKTDTDETDK